MTRRYAAEALGTFTIVFAPVAWASTGAHGGLLAAALVSGLAVLAMIYALGPISAAHFNPAVTFGFTVAGRFPRRYVLPYWIAQFAGALAAALAARLLFGPIEGAHVPTSPDIVRSLGTEIVLSFFLMLVIVAVATDRRVSGTVPALAIGLTVVLCVLIGGPITGGSMNPARSFGPAIVVGGSALSSLWLYFVGPTIGAALAAKTYEAIRLDHDSACGAPNEVLEALEEITA